MNFPVSESLHAEGNSPAMTVASADDSHELQPQPTSSSTMDLMNAPPVPTPYRILPEILVIIIDLLEADTKALGACVLVNRTWMRLARRKLWNRPFMVRSNEVETFLHALHREPEMHPSSFPLPDPAKFITALDFYMTEENLTPFCEVLPRMQPSLYFLVLTVSCSYRRTLELVAQNCPKSVVRLNMWRSEDLTTDEDEYDLVDLVKLRRFISQLIEIRWVYGRPRSNLIVSSGHERLRKMELPRIWEGLTVDFISSCSSALKVAGVVSADFSDETLLLLGRTCTRLRALIFSFDDVSEEAFETFLDVVGGTLEVLEVFIEFELHKVKAITARRCPKLAHLFLFIDNTEPLPSTHIFLNVIHDLGHQLRTIVFNLLENDWEWIGRDLMKALTADCPNIEVFSLAHYPPISDACKDMNIGKFLDKFSRLKLFSYVVRECWLSAWKRKRDGKCSETDVDEAVDMRRAHKARILNSFL
ncbi:hypothetical protein HK102_004666 [Quaeritorhiza haematococci]|nr:hypothetical protein HK102_004666 [Quaeritorhiza haematococci]